MSDTPRADVVCTEIGKLRYSLRLGHITLPQFAKLAQEQLDKCGNVERELNASQSENTRLRAALAVSKSPCVYCSLPAEEWSKCKSGFPGCDRADDAMGCPELGASLAFDDLKVELDAANERIKRLETLGDALSDPFSVGEDDIKLWKRARESKP